MAFNPKDNRPGKMVPVPNITASGKPGELITQLKKLEAQALNELRFREEKKLRVPSNNNPNPGSSKEYYLEWWNIGDPHDAIHMGTCDTINLRHLLGLITGPKHQRKRNMIYIRCEDDGKVIYDKRSTMGR